MRNLNYVSEPLRQRILDYLDSPGTHFFVREIVARGLEMDCVDAWKDVHTAAQILKDVCDDGFDGR